MLCRYLVDCKKARLGRPGSAVKGICPSRCPGGVDRSHPPVPRRNAGLGALCCLHRCFTVFAAAIDVNIMRSNEDETIIQDYVDDAGVVSTSAEERTRMMTVIFEVFAEFCLTASKKTETLRMRVPPPPPHRPRLVLGAAGQRYAQTPDFRCWAALSMKRAYARHQPQWQSSVGALDKVCPGALRSVGIALDSRGRFTTDGGDGGRAVRCLTWFPRRLTLRAVERYTTDCSYGLSGTAASLASTASSRVFRLYKWLGGSKSLFDNGDLTFRGGGARQSDWRLQKRSMFCTLVGDPRPRCPAEHWLNCHKDDIHVFGATNGSTAGDWPTFLINSCIDDRNKERRRETVAPRDAKRS